MPYVQNTEAEVKEMLAAVGVSSIEELFTAIPADLRLPKDTALSGIPATKSEADVLRKLETFARKTQDTASRPTFLGAGIERHFIPTAVDHISLDGNFITAYTPYQPEVSQGTLTAMFQFQTLLSQITGLPVSNASLYDGASAAAEAMMVAYRYCQKTYRKENRERILVPASLHPEVCETLKTYADTAGLKIVSIPYEAETGVTDRVAFDAALAEGGVCAAILPYPTFFGTISDISAMVDATHDAGALAVAYAHPLALSLLKSPGEIGADIAIGEGQPLGCYQALGGPAFGYFSCSMDLIRYAPGRIVSETVDAEGKRAFCLALATREQHIRREKATSNICTNQALMALRATIYLAMVGKMGFIELGEQIASNAHYAAQAFKDAGCNLRFGDQPFFNEFVVDVPAGFEDKARAAGMVPGLDLGRFFPELKGAMLVCVGELTTKDEIDQFVALTK